MHLRVTYLYTVVLCVCAARGMSQAPSPYGRPINIDTAKKVATSALAEAQKNNWKMVISVVDTGGTLVYYEKMDDAQIGSADVAIEKARTAVRFKRPSKVFQDMVASGGAGLRALRLSGAVPFDGGIPLLVNGEIVGAIGVSGDTVDHDGQCAQAGANALH